MRPIEKCSIPLSIHSLRGIDFCNDYEKFSTGRLKIESGCRVV